MPMRLRCLGRQSARFLVPPAVTSGAIESAERAQIAAPVATCSSSFICAGKEGLRREEGREERHCGLWIKCERGSRVWRRDRSGVLYSVCNEMDRRFFTYVRHSVQPRHSYDLPSYITR